ncbi:PAN domain-containing protein At5g03700-like [Zingiber officinale]|uniref:PAN domain-containing protein At5g03700-like n=1 Tax=Zingiber officinale TaxID=94328 RepID=UPI001C4D1869|nr:PAN domain-containing protein At5g03700-like [Zingiber officinale]
MAAAVKVVPFSTPIFLLVYLSTTVAASSVGHEIHRGFSVAHDTSYSQFQPLLADPTGVFSLGFLRGGDGGSSLLDLAVLHLPSSTALWRATLARPLRWRADVSLSFNGSLVLSDSERGIIWSTPAVDAGERLVLLDSSNLQVQKLAAGGAVVVLWESFNFPADTLVQGQNFTSAAVVKSLDQSFSMRVAESYVALYMEFPGGVPPVIYWKHAAMEAKAEIVAGGGAIYARVGEGFLGMYQTDSAPVDVLPFSSFNRGIRGLRRLTLESDGNLRAYYWNGTIWVRDLEAIADRCEIPASCGAYGLCGNSGGCRCLDDAREEEGGCLPAASGDFCDAANNEFGILRRKGVDLAHKELAAREKVASLEECEGSCEQNCSCWGAIYNNASGYCYWLDFPIQSLMEADQSREGYFKVRSTSGGGGGGGRVVVKVALLAVGGMVLAGAAAAVIAYFVQRQRQRLTARVNGMVEGLAPGPYKDLNSASFRSIELS